VMCQWIGALGAKPEIVSVRVVPLCGKIWAIREFPFSFFSGGRCPPFPSALQGLNQLQLASSDTELPCAKTPHQALHGCDTQNPHQALDGCDRHACAPIFEGKHAGMTLTTPSGGAELKREIVSCRACVRWVCLVS